MNNPRNWPLIIGFCLSGIVGTAPLSTITSREKVLTTADSIRVALRAQMERHPASQYRDVYKNFMQDYFGPGHILADTVAASNYLRSELALDEPFDGPLYEPTGYKGNFYRVNLSLLRDSIVPYSVFFDAFVESLQGTTLPEAKEWTRTWEMIDSVIKADVLHFVNERSDRDQLRQQFEKGDYIVHHSQSFNDSSRFHYRIISRNKFHRCILPYLQNHD